MTMPSRYRGVLSLDALMSLLPIILMLMFLLDAMSFISSQTVWHSRNQEAFDRLIAVADHTVKSGAARHEGDLRYPNWIEESKLTEGYIQDLMEKAGLSRLHISLEEPEHEADCVYRIVVVGEQKDISRLFVCGG